MSDTSLWHPFADMATVRHNELVLARGEGVHIWDEAGNRYLDGSASLWYCNIGHGRTEIADAVAEQLRTLETYSIFGEVANRPALDLAAKLAAHAPMDDAKVFFTSGGGDAIDTAAKFARLYWQTIGAAGAYPSLSRGAVRVSLGWTTTEADVEALISAWNKVVSSLLNKHANAA